MDKLAILVFDILEFSGLVSLIVVFCSAFLSSKILRASTWFNLLLAATLSTANQVLLVRQQTGPEPSRPICFLQAILVYPLTVLCSLVGAALLMQVYLSMYFARKSRVLSSTHILLLNTLPLFASFCVLILAFAVGAKDPSTIQRDPSGIRCHIIPSLVPTITTGISMAGGVMIMGFQVLVVINLLHQNDIYQEVLTRNKFSTRGVLRVCVFNVIMMVVMITSSSVWFFKNMDDPAKFRFSNLSMAILPLGEGLIFGTQADILAVWLTWLGLKNEKPLPPVKV